jgi:hypothetical protein
VRVPPPSCFPLTLSPSCFSLLALCHPIPVCFLCLMWRVFSVALQAVADAMTRCKASVEDLKKLQKVIEELKNPTVCKFDVCEGQSRNGARDKGQGTAACACVCLPLCLICTSICLRPFVLVSFA